MQPEPTDDVAAVAALADDLRRRLYRYVARSGAPVGREEAARATGVAVHNAKFHLDRMVDDGLLEVEYQRLSGRTGPGAGRPAKLYRRASREFSVSLPERRYALLSEILAAAAEASIRDRVPVDEVVDDVARRCGTELGRSRSQGDGSELERVAGALESSGYEPRVDGDRVALENCPFHAAAQEHTTLVCGLNLAYVDGLVDGLGCRALETALQPAPDHCCVTVRAVGAD
jgi:predicted ArsR family transcriptional regulator